MKLFAISIGMLWGCPAFSTTACLEHPLELEALHWISFVNLGTQTASVKIGEANREAVIPLYEKNLGPEVFFIKGRVVEGDCLTFNPIEEKVYAIQNSSDSVWAKLAGWFADDEKLPLIPAMKRNIRDQAIEYGLVVSAFTKHLTQRRQSVTSLDQMLSHTNGKDVTMIYVLCPKDRQQTCKLSIKHRGAWVEKEGKKFELDVLTNSKINGSQQRLHANTDTPQGVYYVWARMFSEETAFGGVPRIDLDARLPPINFGPYFLNSYAMEDLLPKPAWQEDWVNEWPIAYAMGRGLIRIHGTESSEPSGLRETDGCIATGHQQSQLLDLLIDIGVIASDDGEDNSLGWQVSPRLGRTFVVVRDTDHL